MIIKNMKTNQKMHFSSLIYLFPTDIVLSQKLTKQSRFYDKQIVQKKYKIRCVPIDIQNLYIYKMMQKSGILNHIHEITYEFNERKYTVKPVNDGVTIIMQDLPLQTRFISKVPRTIFTQELLQRPVQIFDCLVRQYIADYKLPKGMISIEKTSSQTLLIKLTYPGAPIRELRYDCSSQEILNPRLQSYQVILSKMAEKVMKEVIESYMPSIQKKIQQYSDSIYKISQIMIAKMQKKGTEIIHLNEEKFQKINEQARMEICEEIKVYMEQLQGYRVGFRKEINKRAQIMMKQVMHKAKSLEKNIQTLRQNKHQIVQCLYEIELDIIKKTKSIQDQLSSYANKKRQQPQHKPYALLKVENLVIKDSQELQAEPVRKLQRTKSTPKKIKSQITGLYPPHD